MLSESNNHLSCPLQYAVSVFSGKWKPYIIWYLASQNRSVRYSDLKRIIPYDISHKVLSQQLKELVNDGVVSRNAYTAAENKNVLHVEYSLTISGHSLCNILYVLRDWGVAFGDFDVIERMPASKGYRNGNKIVYCSDNTASVKDAIVWMRLGNPSSSQTHSRLTQTA